jgi:hypothetical protein
MNPGRLTQFSRVGAAVLYAMLAAPSISAQSEPATIPTVVAQAANLQFGPIGKPQYFVDRTPPDWPDALVPAGAKIIGGALLGDLSSFRMRTAVFALAARSNSNDALHSLLTRAGYGPPPSESAPRAEGFASSTQASTADTRYCKGPSLASFEVVDSTQAVSMVAIHLIDGEAGRQNCAPQQSRSNPGHMPVTVPTMIAPAGVMAFGASSSWGGTSGNTGSILRTTLGVDSLLSHYTAQLVHGGWKAVGRPAIGDGVAAQRFAFKEGQDDWSAALIILTAGDRREIRLQFTRPD